MPKCPSCPQFTSKDTDTEPEVGHEAVDADGTVEVEVRIHNDCSECGEELEEANFSLTMEIEDAAEHRKTCTEGEYEVSVSATRSDRTQTHDRRGKKIANPRYARRYYGVDVEASVTCSCGETFSVSDSAEGMASGMDSLV